MMADILVVEDMQGIVDSLSLILTVAHHKVDVARDGEEALKKIRLRAYDLVICDIVLPGTDGTSVILEAKSLRPGMPILAISGGATGVTATQALLVASQKADRSLPKPFSRDDLLKTVSELVKA
jgi:DNA-binding NtrC family response regulator